MIRSHSRNSRVLADAIEVCRQTAERRETSIGSRSPELAFVPSTTLRPCEEQSAAPDSPFIVTQGCTRVGSVAEVRVASTVTSAHPPLLVEHVSSRGSGASESRMRVGTFACAKREPPQENLGEPRLTVSRTPHCRRAVLA